MPYSLRKKLVLLIVETRQRARETHGGKEGNREKAILWARLGNLKNSQNAEGRASEMGIGEGREGSDSCFCA